jgi:hypothetical protein
LSDWIGRRAAEGLDDEATAAVEDEGGDRSVRRERHGEERCHVGRLRGEWRLGAES